MTTDDIRTALRYDDPSFSADLVAWCGGEAVEQPDPLDASRDPRAIRVPTRRGPMLAWVGDWIVRNDNDAFTVLPHAEFVAQHEPLT